MMAKAAINARITQLEDLNRRARDGANRAGKKAVVDPRDLAAYVISAISLRRQEAQQAATLVEQVNIYSEGRAVAGCSALSRGERDRCLSDSRDVHAEVQTTLHARLARNDEVFVADGRKYLQDPRLGYEMLTRADHERMAVYIKTVRLHQVGQLDLAYLVQCVPVLSYIAVLDASKVATLLETMSWTQTVVFARYLNKLSMKSGWLVGVKTRAALQRTILRRLDQVKQVARSSMTKDKMRHFLAKGLQTLKPFPQFDEVVRMFSNLVDPEFRDCLPKHLSGGSWKTWGKEILVGTGVLFINVCAMILRFTFVVVYMTLKTFQCTYAFVPGLFVMPMVDASRSERHGAEHYKRAMAAARKDHLAKTVQTLFDCMRGHTNRALKLAAVPLFK